jgi:hypothetical protein
MPELINANPTVLAADAIPSRATKSSPDPFQELLAPASVPEDWSDSPEDNEKESFDAQEIYGTIDCQPRLTH